MGPFKARTGRRRNEASMIMRQKVVKFDPLQFSADRDVGGGGIGQEHMEWPYVPAGSAFAKVADFPPNLCCDGPQTVFWYLDREHSGGVDGIVCVLLW